MGLYQSSSTSSACPGRPSLLPALPVATLIAPPGTGRRTRTTRLTAIGHLVAITRILPATDNGSDMFASRSRALLVALLLAPLTASAQGSATAPTAQSPRPKTIGVPSATKSVEALIVVNARGATLSGQTLTLSDTLPSAVLFADRPVRSAGHISIKEVIELWSSGSFAEDPPNATVSAFQADGSAVSDTVVVLKHPRLEGERLTFEVAILEGDLGKADGPVSVFIDTIWFGIGSGGVSYLGQNQTSGGTTPAVGSNSAFTGWSNPAPDAPPRLPPVGYGTSLTTPPGLREGDDSYKAPCGAPPLLPCY